MLSGYRFTSKELDTETGLYYFGARYLDPQVSRWVSPDPAFEDYLPNEGNVNLPGQGGVFNPININIYCYSWNNPLKYIDPYGFEPTIAEAAEIAQHVYHGREEDKN
jgi:RHS repeat-associated protein